MVSLLSSLSTPLIYFHINLSIKKQTFALGRKFVAVPPNFLLNFITAFTGAAYFYFSLQLQGDFQYSNIYRLSSIPIFCKILIIFTSPLSQLFYIVCKYTVGFLLCQYLLLFIFFHKYDL